MTSSSITDLGAPPPPFNFLPGFAAALTAADGAPSTQAGSHPNQVSIQMGFPTEKPSQESLGAAGHLRDLFVDLPPGTIVNPAATPVRCTEVQLITEEGGAGNEAGCPLASQVGTVTITTIGLTPEAATSPLYNMVTPPGVPSSFGFDALVVGVFPHILGALRSDGDFGLTGVTTNIDALGVHPIFGIGVELWGVPTFASHDGVRGICAVPGHRKNCLGAGEQSRTALLTTAGHCSGRPEITVGRADNWEESGAFAEATYESADPSGTPTTIDGCNALSFEPAIASQSTTNLTDSPSGLDFTLHQPQPPAVEPRDGVLLECDPGSWDETPAKEGAPSPAPTGFAFQWLRNGVPIPGADDPSYQVGSEEQKAPFQCEVTAENAAGHSGSASLPLQSVNGDEIAAPIPGTASIDNSLKDGEKSGTLTEGEGATCQDNGWSGEPAFAYQWFKDGEPIPGATGAQFLAASTPAANYQCELIATNAGGTTVAFSRIESTGTEAEPAPAAPNPKSPASAFIPESQYPLATAQLKDATVTLPAGMAVNPSQADGLEACTPAQIGMTTAVGETPAHFTRAPNTCPDASKIGKVEVKTPLLAEYSEDGTKAITDPETGSPIPRTLPGSLYIAQQGQNPFESLLAIYLAIEDPQSGTVAKLAGEVQTDPKTGQVTTVFKENPQLPIEDIHLQLFGGARGALITPPTCGANATTTDLVPWTSPEGETAHPSDSFQTATTPAVGTCPTSEAQLPSAPSFTAGTTNPQAGAFSPFVLHLSRTDGTQRLTGFDTVLPPGLTGRLAGVPACTDAAIAKAESRSGLEGGAAEKADPSCPAASRLGAVDVAAGAGPTPFHTTGTAYLAGPYKGAPLSMVVITPAIAGPFDLGTVVVRAALNVDPNTTQIHAISDPFPTILHGIPLDLRSVAVSLDRPNFTLNPTSCNEMAITGSATTALNLTTPLTQRFQVGGCQTLPFKPKLSLELKGKTKRTSHPKLIANLTARAGDANIAKAQVKLPGAAFLDQGHIGTSCTRVQFAAKACPPGSVYGTVSATTPLLDYTLTGNVYLRASNHQLPDLVADLNGPSTQPIEIALAGKTDSVKGALRNTFEAVPDQPVTKFHLELFGGKRGLIILSSGLCKSPKASVNLTGQNGKVSDTTPTVKTSCPRKHKAKHHKNAGKR